MITSIMIKAPNIAILFLLRPFISLRDASFPYIGNINTLLVKVTER